MNEPGSARGSAVAGGGDAAGPSAVDLDAVFAALADGTRRDLLGAVGRAGSTTATALARELPITRQAVAKHLSILRDAGLVRAERVGRETRYRFVPGSLQTVDAWVADAEAGWTRRLDALRRHLTSGGAGGDYDPGR